MQFYKILKLSKVILISLWLVSCSSSVKPLKVVASPISQKQLVLPKPLPISVPKPKIKVLTYNTTKDLNSKVEKNTIEPYVYIGFNEQDYISFAQFLNDVLTYLRQQNAIIKTYETSNELQAK